MESTRAGAMRLCPGRVPLPLGPGLCGINANFRECYLAEAQFPRIYLIGSSVDRGVEVHRRLTPLLSVQMVKSPHGGVTASTPAASTSSREEPGLVPWLFSVYALRASEFPRTPLL